ncbi:putative porin, partial [Steroidobacter agaridevorans]|uniref:putative porin n=1 Tax=Steroidobacter agaridevorans TaxID=2695856 RepID=UPI00192A41EA
MKVLAAKSLCRAAVALTVLMHAPAWSQTADAEKRSLEEVRNTVINLLQALVQKGVMTREQAEAMVADAQAKATADANARAAKEAAESDAVRVTYVPESVRKQIAAEVRADMKAEVTQEVMAQAKSDGWGVPGALPGW